MVTVRLREHVKRRLTCQVVKCSCRVDQTPVKEYPSCWAIGGDSAIGNSELDGAPCEGGYVDSELSRAIPFYPADQRLIWNALVSRSRFMHNCPRPSPGHSGIPLRKPRHRPCPA